MCVSLENRYRKERIISAIETMQEDGKTETDIVERIIQKYKVTKEYVQELLSPKTA